MGSPGRALDPLKLIVLIIFDSLWVSGALGNIRTSIVSNSPFGKRPWVLDMSISGYHFLLHVTNNVFSD